MREYGSGRKKERDRRRDSNRESEVDLLVTLESNRLRLSFSHTDTGSMAKANSKSHFFSILLSFHLFYTMP